MRKWMMCLIIGISIITFMGCNSYTSSLNENTEEEENKARTTPYGKYPKEVVYTLGKMTGANNSNMPIGDTYENNAYTRYLKDKLNIQNKDVFEESTDYDNTALMAITTEDLPDVMVVSDMEQLQMLVEKDLIEDLTEVYNNCTSERIKEMYESYGDEILENATIDGKLMALPETNIENGPSLIWLRKDWMDKLHLAAPRTMEDLEHVVKEFVVKDPGGNGKGNTIGLVCDYNIVGEPGYSYEYQLDIAFACSGAFPRQFYYDKDGNLVYGSIQPEAKEALKRLRKIYKSGILDSKFLLRTTEDIIDLIVKGKCGSFFGPWWAPNNPLIDAKKYNADAEWEPYLIQTDQDGRTSYASQNPSYKYVVVRKGYEHPEIVMKIISVLFDYARFKDTDVSEIALYYKLNVDPTARPLAINVDYADALIRCYHHLTSVLNGKERSTNLEKFEQSYFDACDDYLNHRSEATNEDWAAYTSRLKACAVMTEGNTYQKKSLFFGETNTMKQEWSELKRLEEETYLKIITGEVPIDYFDWFVLEWKRRGGQTIMREVKTMLDTK